MRVMKVDISFLRGFQVALKVWWRERNYVICMCFCLTSKVCAFNFCKEVVYVLNAIISYFHNLSLESTICVFLSLVNSDYKTMVNGV